ncbi:proline-rich transmembrane protein 3 [Esox lucius]|uniref:Proline-rich transmembrane protein 3/4 domain-containing protein n=1 Tax=Esox lucius TaxID=8010 RepID=A0A3P8XU98_ESOLU|nr:proline-rich transmembrane protein 3 [Esox lucius]XP_019910944.3 proline-rich transmembrane protein 3 [Esox lucius]XP_019910945.3 proline-rich transmembrane protein 3 [Esox lucius]XP_034143012.1 proline-rich transmembrane protein 3 [Esox lucius]
MAPLSRLVLVLSALLHCSPGRMIGTTSATHSSGSSDLVRRLALSSSKRDLAAAERSTTQQPGTDVLMPAGGTGVPGKQATDKEELAGSSVGRSRGSDESVDDGGLGDEVLIDDDPEPQSVPSTRHIPSMFFPAPVPLPPVPRDHVSPAEPDRMAQTKLSLTATSETPVSLVKDDHSGPYLEPGFPTVEISEQMTTTVKLKKTRPNIARGDGPEKGRLGENEEQGVVVLKDIFVIDSLEPVSSNTQGKHSHSSTLSSANPGQAPLLTYRSETDKSIPDTPTTESSVLPSPVIHTTHQHGRNVKVLPAFAVRYDVFGHVTHRSLNGGPCVQALGPCVVPTATYGTMLLWEDLSRTLAFAWELHVYGSACLFLLLSCVAALGMIGGSTKVHHLCGNLTLANGLLLLTGALRAVLLLTDPYGTRRVLSRPVLTALYNLPLPLMLWAQVALNMIPHRRADVNQRPSPLQRPYVVGGLAVTHCTLLLGADLLSPALSPDLPVALQSLSLCWCLPLCLGLLTQSLSHLHPFSKTPIPQWGTPQRSEERARRVAAVCALLGLLCLGMQIYSLLWLYGLLGDWRRFSWGWWLGQFWARVLELFWCFSMLVLASWVFWTPRRSRARCEHNQRKAKGLSFWERVQETLWMGPFRKSEKNWAELMPNNWAGQHPSRTDSGSILGVYDDPHTADSLRDTVSLPHQSGGGGVHTASSGEAHLLWQQMGERECILSFIEFDMRPPSPINLSLSIDNALQRDHRHLLGVGSLFSAPLPSSWALSAGATDSDPSRGDNELAPASPTFSGYGWGRDADSRPVTPDHFSVKEQPKTESQPYSIPEHHVEKVPDNDVYISMVLDEVSKPGITEEEDWGCVGVDFTNL